MSKTVLETGKETDIKFYRSAQFPKAAEIHAIESWYMDDFGVEHFMHKKYRAIIYDKDGTESRGRGNSADYTPEGRQKIIDWVKRQEGLYPHGRLYFLRKVDKMRLRKSINQVKPEDITAAKRVLEIVYQVLRKKLHVMDAVELVTTEFPKPEHFDIHHDKDWLYNFWWWLRFGAARKDLVTEIGKQKFTRHTWDY